MSGTGPAIATFFTLAMAACGSMPPDPGPEVRQAMAPTGRLRVALFEGNAAHAIKDKSTGEMKGVGHDLGRQLAGRLGVPFEPASYSSFPALLEAGRKGTWDVGFLGVTADRAEFLNFTQNHIEIEYGYLVPADSTIADLASVDRRGIRIAVVARGTPAAFLAGVLKNATLVGAASLPQALKLVTDRQADLVAGGKPAMFALSAQLPGSRVLEGRPGVEESALAIPKGRGSEASAYARRFIQEVKEDGSVRAAIERAGLRGVIVAP